MDEAKGVTWCRAGERAGSGDNAINALHVCERAPPGGGHVVLAGSKDGQVCAWKLKQKDQPPSAPSVQQQRLKYVPSDPTTHTWEFEDDRPLWTIDLNRPEYLSASMLPTNPDGDLKTLKTTTVRSICLCTRRGGQPARLLVGTRGCEVFEFEMNMVETHEGHPLERGPRLLAHGHCLGELWLCKYMYI